MNIALLFENERAVVVKPSANSDLLNCVRDNASDVRDLMRTHGALLFRGFNTEDGSSASQLLRILYEEPIEYEFYSTPRTKLGNGVYTTTEYPQSQRISLHSEMTYGPKWPHYLAFACVTPASEGGETPIADIAKLSKLIGSDLLDEFAEKGVTYVRNYRPMIDVPWQRVFQTDDPDEVVEFCNDRGIEAQWINPDWLRTTHGAQGAILSPRDGKDKLWFNQSHVFHISSVPAAVRTSIERMFRPEEFPRNCFLGRDEVIEDKKLEFVRNAMRASERSFSWAKGDLLLLDNLQFAHARASFTGERKIVVAMTKLVDRQTITALP